MPKNHSIYMLQVFLGLGTIIGLLFPFVLQLFIEIPKENFKVLQLLAISTGWFLGVVNFVFYYYFSLSIVRRFQDVLTRVRSEDYQAGVEFSNKDMLGLLANDINATLSHLEDKNNEVQHDDLTGLPNRQFLKHHFNKLTDSLTENKIAFLFFDIDKFKRINDDYGHPFGDKILIEVAKRVQPALLQDEVLFRLSGDEFLLVAKLSSDSSAIDVADQLQSLFSEPFNIQGIILNVQISIGVSVAPIDGNDLHDLIRNADFAMYAAKKIEGSAYHLFENIQEYESVGMIKNN